MTLEFNQAEESVISIDNVIGNIDLSLSIESPSVEAIPVDVVLSASNELNIEVVLDNQEVPLSVTIEPQMALNVDITTNDSIDFTIDVNTDINKGDKGDQGSDGQPGPKGDKGDKGDRGDTGATGQTGNTGSTGSIGPKGDKGDKGDLGLTGAKGDKGDQGNQGFKGDKGDTGLSGDKGDQGMPGAEGPQGIQGAPGQDGLTTSVNGVTQINGNVTLTKADIGLVNVDNTSDLNKPISTATQSALDLKLGLNTPITAGSNSKITYDSHGLVVSSSKADISDINNLTSALSNKLETSLKGAINGLAELDSSGFVKNSQLPSYVDDVLEYSSITLFPATGESGKIYIDTTTNLTYRWSGSIYALISQSLALGETSSTAYRGDRGKTAYDHSQIITGNPHNTSKTDIGLSNVPNLSFSGSNTGDETITTIKTKLGVTTLSGSNTGDQTLSGLGGQPQLNGTGFVKSSGTTVSYDNSSYYLASNPNSYISGITKANVESVLTGLITTHTHNYLSSFTETDPIFTAWNKSTGISITKSQVSNFPTNLSQFTNNLGNYGGWITGINSGMVTTALGYTPWNTSSHPTTISGYGITDIPTYSGSNFILNQNASAQSANMWISGVARANSHIRTGVDATMFLGVGGDISGGYSSTDFILFNTGGDAYLLGTGAQGLKISATTGAATFASIVNATQLQSTVATGTSPLTVNSTTIVSNLNAEYLGNKSESSYFVGELGNATGQNANDLTRHAGYNVFGMPSSLNYPIDGGYGSVLNFNTYYGTQLYFNYDGSSMYFRSTRQVVSPWNKVYHSGNLTNTLSTNYLPKWNGSSMVNSLISESGSSISVSGTVTASNFILSSDRTLKTNIQPIIKDYSRLNLVSFNFKNNLDELRFGTIAQDLLSNGFDEFVTGDKEGEYKVKYIDLLVAKIAYLEVEINKLKNK